MTAPVEPPATPLPIALMRLAAGCATREEALARLPETGVERVMAERLLTPAAFARVKAVLAAVDHTGTEVSLDAIAAGFDRAAAISPEGGVALYSLGDPVLLAAVTAEVVGWMAAEGLLGPGKRVLEVGCGIGRFLTALGPRVEVALGLDISPAMLAEAGARCAGVGNALPVRGSGRDLACVATESVDLLLFADSFPYLVQAGRGLPARHVTEARRVLRTGGRLLILNYSYRGDAEQDRREAEALASAHGLTPVVFSQPRFDGWDAAVFLFSR